MMVAAGKVVDKRTQMITSAGQFPLSGNYKELGKMVPEKIKAFGEAAEILVDEWGEWQRSVARQLSATRSAEQLALPGSSCLYGWVDSVSRLWAAPAKALVPIHKAATENALRLQNT